jgi:predicted O-methyltransferase YrrM
MSRSSELFAPGVCEYIVEHSVRDTPLQKRLRDETAAHPHGSMQVPPEEGQLLGLLVKLMGARRVLEIGVFTGYSSLSIALALPADGHLVACDISDEYTAVARRYWAEAGVAEKVHLRIGPASDTLRDLVASGTSGTFDMAFMHPSDEANVKAIQELNDLIHADERVDALLLPFSDGLTLAVVR